MVKASQIDFWNIYILAFCIKKKLKAKYLILFPIELMLSLSKKKKKDVDLSQIKYFSYHKKGDYLNKYSDK